MLITNQRTKIREKTIKIKVRTESIIKTDRGNLGNEKIKIIAINNPELPATPLKAVDKNSRPAYRITGLYKPTSQKVASLMGKRFSHF
jgi:hypothetical protein